MVFLTYASCSSSGPIDDYHVDCSKTAKMEQKHDGNAVKLFVSMTILSFNRTNQYTNTNCMFSRISSIKSYSV